MNNSHLLFLSAGLLYSSNSFAHPLKNNNVAKDISKIFDLIILVPKLIKKIGTNNACKQIILQLINYMKVIYEI